MDKLSRWSRRLRAHALMNFYADDVMLFSQGYDLRQLRGGSANGESSAPGGVREWGTVPRGWRVRSIGGLVWCQHLNAMMVKWEPRLKGKALNSPSDLHSNSHFTLIIWSLSYTIGWNEFPPQGGSAYDHCSFVLNRVSWGGSRWFSLGRKEELGGDHGDYRFHLAW